MGALFGSDPSQRPVRYAGMQVSTSAYGQPIPYVAGRQRVPMTLAWYGNFKSTGSGGGGKGGGSPSSWDYSAAWLAVICLGPAQNIFTVWHDQSVVDLTDENLSFALGSSGQPIWSGYPSNTPSVQKIPYDHMAYVATPAYDFGSSPAMPNLTFEMEGTVSGYSDAHGVYDADPTSVITQYLTDPVIGAGFQGSIQTLTGTTNSVQAYVMSLGLLTSPYENNQRAATDFVKELLQIMNCEAFLSVGQLKILPLTEKAVSGTTPDGVNWSYTPNLTPQFSFTDDHYVPQPGEPPVKVTRKALNDTYNSVNLQYNDRSNQYNPAPINASVKNDIALYGERVMTQLSFPQITTSATAMMAGQLILQRQLYERNTLEFRVRQDFCQVEPNDYIAVTDSGEGYVAQLCRVIEVDEDQDRLITIKAVEIPGISHTTPQYNWNAAAGYAANWATAPGSVLAPTIFQMPAIPGSLGEGITVGIAVAPSASSTYWKGCHVWCSVDGGNDYFQVGVIGPEGTPRYGTITSNVPAVADPDTTTTVGVALNDTALQLSTAVTHGQADANQTLILIGTGTTAEVMSYGTAALVSAGNYNLSYLRRNLYGSTNQSHTSGVPFVRLDGSIFQLAFDPGMAGQTVYFKFTSFNTWGRAEEALSAVTAYSYAIPAANAVSGSVTLIPRGSCAFTGESAYKVTTGVAAWDSDCVGAKPLTAGNISSQYGAGSQLAVGFVTSTSSTANPTTNMYAIYAQASQVQVIENGTAKLTLGTTPAVGDLYDVRYDGFTLHYLVNGVQVWSTPLQGASLYPAIAEYTAGAVLSDVQVISGAGATPTQWVATGNCIVNDTNAMKVGGSAAWDSCAYSITGYAQCHVTGKANQNTSSSVACGIGLSQKPTTASSYTNADFALLATNTPNQWQIYESGTLVSTLGNVNLTDTVWISYDGTNVRYYVNDPTTPVHTTPAASLTLYGFCPFYGPGAGINSVRFAPGGNLALIDTAQVGQNAAGQIGSAVVNSTGSVNATVGHTTDTDIVSLTLTTTGSPIGIDATVYGGVPQFNGVVVTGNVSIYRDGTQIGTSQFDLGAGSTLPNWVGQVTLTVDDTPSAGSHTYTMHVHLSAGGSTGSGSFTWEYPSIKVREYKR